MPRGIPANTGSKRIIEEASNFARLITENKEYRDGLLKRAISGSLPAAVETLLLNYAYGVPTQHVTVEATEEPRDLSQLSDKQLQERVKNLSHAVAALTKPDKTVH